MGRFFPTLYEDYLKEWPPTPTEQDVTKAGGNVAVATATVQKDEETVRDSKLTALTNG